MDITTKLIEGVVDLTKLMAHGAMHEACLIEVVKTTEDEAFELVKKIRNCTSGIEAKDELDKFMAENNATVLDIIRPNKIENVKDKAGDIKAKPQNVQVLNAVLGSEIDEKKSQYSKNKL